MVSVGDQRTPKDPDTTIQDAGAEPGDAAQTRKLSILLSMAMFVLVVDTSLMNVSISAVVRDLDMTVSAVQSAIALEALVFPDLKSSSAKHQCFGE